MKRLFVVSHDAGGAEVISSWLSHHYDEWDVTYLLDGPAVEIFRSKLGQDLVAWSDAQVQDHDFVLCGSSGRDSSELERTVVLVARGVGVPCAVWLDHWKRYAERFRIIMPNEIWVCDAYAEAIAQGEFPRLPILVKGNPYLEDFATSVESVKITYPNGPERILQLGEPDDEEIRDRYASYVRMRAVHSEVAIRVRPHPSVLHGDHAAARALYEGLSRVSIEPCGLTLARDVAWAETVLGGDTMALVAALAAGRHVVSVLPASEASIPYPEIERPYG